MWRCSAIFLSRNCGTTSIVMRVQLGMEDALYGQREVGPAGHIVDILLSVCDAAPKRVSLPYARLKRSRISGTICHQLESLELSPWKRSIRAFQLQFMASSSWRHTAILKSLRLPYLTTCSWIRTSSAAISINERARNVHGGCWRDLGALFMLSRQAIHIRRVRRRLLAQVPGHLRQHHYQDAGAAADPGCCDDPPCRNHPLTPLFRRRGCRKLARLCRWIQSVPRQAHRLSADRHSYVCYLTTFPFSASDSVRYPAWQSRCYPWPEHSGPHGTAAVASAGKRHGGRKKHGIWSIQHVSQLYSTSWLPSWLPSWLRSTWPLNPVDVVLPYRDGLESQPHDSQGIVLASVSANGSMSACAGAAHHLAAVELFPAHHMKGDVFQRGDLR